MNSEGKDKEGLYLKAKRYSSIKYATAIIDTAYILCLLFLFQYLGFSRALAEGLSRFFPGKLFTLPLYILAAGILYYLLDFPFNLFHSFFLEHKFCLSTQKLSAWLKDQLKGGLISYIITLIVLCAFYFILGRYPQDWWPVISLFWIFFSLILAKLTPIIIIPLFFKYKKISDAALKERIMNLAQKMKIKIMDIFEIDFSKKTLKANAAFVGWGKSRRVILADTLKDKYSDDEIEVILAHEFAHYRLKHLLKLILINSTVIILSFYLIFKTSHFFLSFFRVTSLSDIAALPVVAMYMLVLGIILQPFQNYLSRRMEKNADIAAIKTTGLKEAFVSMMEKLALQNLADRKPHPLIKIFFFDHPPVDERIAIAKKF